MQFFIISFHLCIQEYELCPNQFWNKSWFVWFRKFILMAMDNNSLTYDSQCTLIKISLFFDKLYRCANTKFEILNEVFGNVFFNVIFLIPKAHFPINCKLKQWLLKIHSTLAWTMFRQDLSIVFFKYILKYFVLNWNLHRHGSLFASWGCINYKWCNICCIFW